MLITSLFALSLVGFATGPQPQSARVVARCQRDVTGDGQSESVMLVEENNEYELRVTMGGKTATPTEVLFRDAAPGELSCKEGRTVRETRASGGSGKRIQTPGAYIELVFPEQSLVAFVWTGDGFIAVWTSD